MHENHWRFTVILCTLLPALALLVAGCRFDQLPPGEDRAAMVATAMALTDQQPSISQPITPTDAVCYALAHNFDIRAAQIEIAYQEESRRGSMLRLLPRLQTEMSIEHRNHPDASYSEGVDGGGNILDYSFSRDRTQKPFQVAMLWNVLDFGVGYLRARQSNERIFQSQEQVRRLRQQTALDTTVAYWRAWAARENAADARELMAEMERQLTSVRLARQRNILPEAEGVRRELALLSGLVDAENWLQSEDAANRELARAMGYHGTDFILDADAGVDAALASLPMENMRALQERALSQRPELFQSDSQARISCDDARIALLQIAPNVNLSLAFDHNDDSHLKWNDWMTTGIRASWNLLSIPSRLSEKKAAELQGQAIREKNLAMSAAILAQLGMAMSEWRQASATHDRLRTRLEARQTLVEALMEAEQNNQARQADVMQERIRLLGERAAVRMQQAEIRSSLARLGSALGLDIDAEGKYVF